MKPVLTTALLLAFARIASGQSILAGRVLASDSTPIIAAHVILHDSTGKFVADALTDSVAGFRFRITRPARPVTLHLSVRRIGFVAIERAPVRVGWNEEVTVRVLLLPDAIELAPIAVVARRRTRSAVLDEYYDKLAATKRGPGRALERDALEKYSGRQLIHALLSVPGVQFGGTASPGGSSLSVPRMRQGCIPMTYLDRLPVDPDQLAMMDPADLEGVLVYVGEIEVPPEYSRLIAGSQCGLILGYSAAVKTRRRFSLITAAAVFGTFTAALFLLR